jgi:Protein of unknown function (DUF2400)
MSNGTFADLQIGGIALQIGRRGGAELKAALDRLYETFNDPHSATDPIQIVRRFARADDREVVGFCAGALAFGRVTSVLHSIERLLVVMGESPAAYVRGFHPAREASIEAFFLEGHYTSAADVGPALDSFSTRALALDLRAVYGRVLPRAGVRYFFPRPSAGSACKRLNLFLRWMVRRDALDLGVWTGVLPAALVVPLDTHVIRVGRCLRLTRYTSPGWRMAADITASLRALDPSDPVKYDFSLCHLGMMNACGFSRPQKDAQCPLRGVCRPRARTRASSPGPFVRP